MEDASARFDQLAELLAEPREVRGVNRRLDLDSLDPSVAPGVSNLEPGFSGFTIREATRVLQGLRGLDVIGADVVCLMPTKDNPNQITAQVAMVMMFELL